MFRPPARDICLNALEDVYNTYEESRPAAGKILSRWRPGIIEQTQQEQQQQQQTLASRPAVPESHLTPPQQQPPAT
ncbi:hypothetical protein LTS12_029243 [Elasticomyces elasticus]|nr:hypothetical protein LTS12_029243 [Elasticomyces elasticus]